MCAGFVSRGGRPDGYYWRGIEFCAPRASDLPAGFYSSVPITLGEDGRAADWKFHQPKTVWHARLRIGVDRYPGAGATPAEALDAAAAEAANVAAFIVAMLPPTSSPAAELDARGRTKRKRRAVKVRRVGGRR